MSPAPKPSKTFETKMCQTLLALYIINQATTNGTFTTIIATLRPSASVWIEEIRFSNHFCDFKDLRFYQLPKHGLLAFVFSKKTVNIFKIYPFPHRLLLLQCVRYQLKLFFARTSFIER